MTIIDHLSPNHSARKAGVRVDTVLLHHTASLDSWPSVEWLCNPKSGVSAHYVVTNGGTIYRLVPEHLKAWHAGLGHLPWERGPWKMRAKDKRTGRIEEYDSFEGYDFNHRSIGIEIVNPGDGKTPFTEAQYRALAGLVPDIVRRLGWTAAVFCNGWTPETLGERVKIDADADAPVVRGYILGHRDVAPGRKTDPADNFDWGRIREALAGAGGVA